MGTRTARAIDLATRLTVATGHEPEVDTTAEHTFITATIPEGLTEARRRSVLAALAGLPATDTYGHELTATGELVWAELHDQEAQNTTSSPDVAR